MEEGAFARAPRTLLPLPHRRVHRVGRSRDASCRWCAATRPARACPRRRCSPAPSPAAATCCATSTTTAASTTSTRPPPTATKPTASTTRCRATPAPPTSSRSSTAPPTTAPFATVRAARSSFLAARQPGACAHPMRSCVANPDVRIADLGAAALALLAVGEFEASTGERTQMAWARRLAAFLLFMQKDDGDFCHLFDVARRPARREDQAALLLGRGRLRARQAGRAGRAGRSRLRALGRRARSRARLPHRQAVRARWPASSTSARTTGPAWPPTPAGTRCRRRIASATRASATSSSPSSRRTQFDAATTAVVAAQPDFVGAYGFSPLLPPHATPVGSRSETAISTYAHAAAPRPRRRRRRSRHARADPPRHAVPARPPDPRRQRLSHGRIPRPRRGGFLMSDVKRYVRIDFVQHSCSAMLRAIAVL